MSPHAFEREAKILARQLLKQKAWLECRSALPGNGLAGEKTNWCVVSPNNKRKKPGAVISTALVEAMQLKNWLNSDPSGAIRLSAAGIEKLLSANAKQEFAAQHQQRQTRVIKDQQGLTVSVVSNETESPLGWMRVRKDKTGKPLLSNEQFEAGERIRREFTLAQMSARVTSSWDFTGPAGRKNVSRAENSMEISERALAAKQRFFAALDYLGPELANIVFEVCCLASGLESAERQFGWPRRSAKLVLQIALTKLSEHYGLVRPDAKPPHCAAIQHWGKEGFRPRIPPSEPAS